MSNKRISSAAFTDTKPHYELLDGLRGVAALLVLWYHIFEGFASSPIDQNFNHGYLAVDFFFILSGFVIGYAYDDRWKKMKTKEFFKRRLIRLHPMWMLGILLGCVTFCIQGCQQWDGSQVSFSWVLIAMLLSTFLIPAIPGSGVEIRGNGEMFPLNGPSWSLFFEYIANIFYAFFLRRFSTKTLAAFVCITGIGYTAFAVGNLSGFGHMGVGWSLLDYNFLGGMIRVTFSFSMGLLLSRKFNAVSIKGAFWICAISLLILLGIPHIGNENTLWQNGLYDSICVIIFFPLLVYIGASGKTTDKVSSGICKFLGDISYPIYIIHYPFYYLFYAWLWKDGFENRPEFAEVWPIAILLFLAMPILAYICLKVYDEPVRKWLTKRFQSAKTNAK